MRDHLRFAASIFETNASMLVAMGPYILYQNWVQWFQSKLETQAMKLERPKLGSWELESSGENQRCPKILWVQHDTYIDILLWNNMNMKYIEIYQFKYHNVVGMIWYIMWYLIVSTCFYFDYYILYYIVLILFVQLHLDPVCFFFQLGEMQCDRFGDGWDGSIGRELAWADQVSECVWNKMFVWGSQE